MRKAIAKGINRFFCKYYERTGVCPAFYNCSFEVGERSEVGAIEVLKNIRKLLSEKFTLRSNLQNLSTAYPPLIHPIKPSLNVVVSEGSIFLFGKLVINGEN